MMEYIIELAARSMRDSIKESSAFSPDGKLLASGAASGVILFWGLSDGRSIGDLK